MSKRLTKKPAFTTLIINGDSMTGSIYSIKGNIVTIKCNDDVCSSCLSLSCKGKDRFVTVENTKAMPLSIGQVVEVKANHSLLAKQIIVAFVPPLLGFIVGFMTIRLFFSQASEALQVVCGLAGLFAAAFIVYIKVPTAYQVSRTAFGLQGGETLSAGPERTIKFPRRIR